MPSALNIFTERLYCEWLPNFCYAPHRNYSIAGFKRDSISKLSEFDARWFLIAIEYNLVIEQNGFFTAALSKAKEQIFWQGSKTELPRPVTLWVEPVITIGALARLHKEFGWPIEKLGTQSKTWAFDLVGYGNTSDVEQIVCEVKKEKNEIITLLRFMKRYCSVDPMSHEPGDSKEKNAYRKVQGVRRSWPALFWALGPRGEGEVFFIHRAESSPRFLLNQVQENELKYKNTQ